MVLVCAACTLSAQSPPEVQAKSAIILDAFTGKTLYEKNAQMRTFPASTTKILTALLIIESGNLDQTIHVTPSDTRVEPTVIGLRPSQVVTRDDLLHVLMLKSANDAAITLARDNAGSVAEFARRMTQRAHRLGAKASNFTNPHGLHSPDHYSTAADLAMITRAALGQATFRQLVSTSYFRWTNMDGSIAQVTNRNRLLANYAGCTGVKTGFTRAAGQVLVSSALREGVELIVVVLNTTNRGIWTDSEALLDYGFSLTLNKKK